MKNEVTIRFATEADLPEIIELCRQHADFEKADYDRSGKEEKLKKYLFTDPGGLHCLGATVNGTVEGYASYIKQFSTWDADFYLYMDCLYLHDEFRGYGLGEQLMNRIKEEAGKMECTLIQWQTPDFNTRAMKFYRRIGAYSKSEERFYWEL